MYTGGVFGVAVAYGAHDGYTSCTGAVGGATGAHACVYQGRGEGAVVSHVGISTWLLYVLGCV